MIFSAIGKSIGIGESVVRLLTVVLLGYPIAQIYRLRFLGSISGLSQREAVQIRNNYLVAAGVSLSFLYNGWDIKHSLATVLTTYGLCYIGGIFSNRFISVVFVFVFNLVYLTVGYYYNSGGDYDLTWTMPQCVLCLRMIGFGIDYYDGGKQLVGKPKDIKTAPEPVTKPVSGTSKPAPKAKTISFTGNTSLAELPRLDHFFGYAYFFSAFLVGPQFSFSLYYKFINAQNLTLDVRGFTPGGAVSAAKNCFLIGIGYLALQHILNDFAPPSYLLSSEYSERSFLYRLVVMWICGKGIATKYLGIWILNEGASILSGISFNGYDAQGKAEWNGLTNMDWMKFETATTLDDIISSFNINTNLWIKEYVFKRLRFLNSKSLSQIGSLIFLAIWHGFLSGYFMCFALEFVYMAVEKQMKILLEPYTSKLYQSKSPLRFLITIGCYIYTSSALFYTIISFGLLRFPLYKQAYNSVYWIGHVVLVLLIGCRFVFKPSRLPKVLATKANKKQN